MVMKKTEFMDLFINELDYALGVLTRKVKKNIPADDSMNKSNQKKSINLMRVNQKRRSIPSCIQDTAVSSQFIETLST